MTHTRFPVLTIVVLVFFTKSFGQTNLLLNGGFEDINVCTEYNSECGVEAWFYLKDVKAQMLENENGPAFLGKNSFALFFNWFGYTDFSPLIGTVLPCKLQKNARYKFKGVISATMNTKLLFRPGVALGEKFYVPRKTFSAAITPDSITQIRVIPNSSFFEFEYDFTATGEEQYLTFGTYIREDTSLKFKLKANPPVSIVLDNFELTPMNPSETVCNNYEISKHKIYDYNFRHKEMDYSLFTKGELKIDFDKPDSNSITTFKRPVKSAQPDTLRLSDVLFDFNKATLKAQGIGVLQKFFLPKEKNLAIDSVYVEGHTDSIGSDEFNLKLSQARSQSVAAWLSENKILPSSQVQIHSFGRSRPTATNKTPQGRSLNRRVELIIFRRKAQ